MLEKPDVADEKIITCLHNDYGVTAAALHFLPIGYDASAWVYRVGTGNEDYFLKVRRGTIDPAVLLIPRYLKDSGIEQVVAPLRSQRGQLWQSLGEFNLMLYPYIEGSVGMEVGLSEGQWRELGAVLKRIHATELPADLLAQVQKETFVPRWLGMVGRLQAIIAADDFDDPHRQAMALFWREKGEEIGRVVARTEELGRMMRERAAEFVLCHADIHTANVLLDGEKLFIVDWDQPILAPKERDLMFVVGDRQAGLFFEGYGETDIDRLALAYYRYEWVVQELGDFGERVFLLDDVGEVTRADSVQGFRNLFRSGDVVEAAIQSEVMLRPEFRPG